MIATKNQPLTWKTHFLGDAIDKITKVSRFHAGITAKLIHLIGCGFNQYLVVSIEIEKQS